MMARFVAMHIAAQQAFLRHILGLGEKLGRQVHRKQGIELGDKRLVASHQLNHIIDVLRNIERIVQGISFDKPFTMRTQQAEVFFPASVRITGTGVTDTCVEHIDIVGCPFFILVCHPVVSCQTGGIINRPVIVGIFQR